MKLSNLRTLIREEIQKEVFSKKAQQYNSLTENIVADIIALVLTPKVRKDAAKLKNSPEWKELEAQAKKATAELEMINKRLERLQKEQEDLAKEAKKLGVKYKPGMNAWEIRALFDPIYAKMGLNVKKK